MLFRSGDSTSGPLRQLLGDVGVGIWRFDGATRKFTLDAICRDHFGLKPGEPPSAEVMRRRIHPEDIGGYFAAIHEVMANDGEFSIEYRVVDSEGRIRVISSRGRVNPHGPGEPLVIDGVCIDVSERFQLQERLHKSEVQLAALAETFPGLFCYVDRDFIVRFISDRYVAHNGQPREKIVGHHLSKVVGDARFQRRQSLYQRVLDGEAHSFEESKELAAGGSRYYAMTYYPDKAPNGAVQGFMAIGLDITDLRSMERDLREKSSDLSRSNHDLEQFAYVASHDLKAPLRAIEVLVDWLSEDLQGFDKGDVQENLGLLKQRTGRLHRLLDDLLEYSRAGRSPGEIRTIDVRQMVEDVGILLAPPSGMKVVADASLPTLTTWHAPLEQVLRNLVNNAIKHHPTKQGLVRIFAEQCGDDLVMAVEDDGAGIPEKYAEKVFQMFQTLKPRDEVEGSGMGLAIVKRIVEWQGGRVWFQPGPNGRGTVFKFTWNPAAASLAAQTYEHHDTDSEQRHLAG